MRPTVFTENIFGPASRDGNGRVAGVLGLEECQDARSASPVFCLEELMSVPGSPQVANKALSAGITTRYALEGGKSFE